MSGRIGLKDHLYEDEVIVGAAAWIWVRPVKC